MVTWLIRKWVSVAQKDKGLFIIYRGVNTEEKLVGWQKLYERIRFYKYIIVQYQGLVKRFFQQEILIPL